MICLPLSFYHGCTCSAGVIPRQTYLQNRPLSPDHRPLSPDHRTLYLDHRPLSPNLARDRHLLYIYFTTLCNCYSVISCIICGLMAMLVYCYMHQHQHHNQHQQMQNKGIITTCMTESI